MGAKGAADGFNRFVEGESSQRRNVPIDESKKDFWDSFADAGTARTGGMGGGSSAVGTSAIKKPATPMGPKKDEDAWEKW
jgi:ADP-ribosylation factor GTPase-activating protein 1